MPRKKLPYAEGDWFALPLDNGRYALGLIARIGKSGAILGYFFGYRGEGLPSEAETRGLMPDKAILVCRVVDLAILDGRWRIIGQTEDWRPEDWPLPTFGEISSLDATAWKVEYDPNLLRTKTLTPISVEEAKRLPDGSYRGVLPVESHLSRLLSEGKH